MKLLLDECMPRRLKRDLVGHEVSTVDEAGLKGLKTGKLLAAAIGAGFDVLLTVDKNIPFQQNMKNLNITLILLRVHRNTYEEIKSLAPQVLSALTNITKGEVRRIIA